jgi:transposase, IS30 family
MTYTHLTQEERYQIQALHISGRTKGEIARQLGRHCSTIGREITRAGAAQGYQAAQAQVLADQRQRLCRNARTTAPEQWQQVRIYLRLWLSPEQIRGRLLLQGAKSVSHESIYRYIYRDKANGGDLLSYLRCQKQRRKRYGSGQERRGALKNRVGIEHRPAIVESRQRIGDWEGDTVIGKGQQGVLVTLVERKSRFTLARALPCREASVVQQAIIELLRPHKEQCVTLTFDNGKEFAEHEFIGQCLDASVYFARPYHSWERGTNENTNGLLRQFFPKCMGLLNVSDVEVNDALYRLNHRPRKCLGYRTPHEVFYDLSTQPLN